MASYFPPIEDLPIFDSALFNTDTEFLSKIEADKLYLKFPTAQGDETLLNATVAGDLQVNNKINFYNVGGAQVDAYFDEDISKNILRVSPPEEGFVIGIDTNITPIGTNTVGGRLVLTDPSSGVGFNTTLSSILGKLIFSGHSTNNAIYDDAYIQGFASGTFSNTSRPSSLAFFTTPIGSAIASRRMTITESGFVGINTTVPTCPLYIGKSTGVTENVIIDGTISGTNNPPLLTFFGNKTIDPNYNLGRLQLLIAATAGSGSSLSEPYDSVIRAGAAEATLPQRLILTSKTTGGIVIKDQTIGINTKDPLNTLHITNPVGASSEVAVIDGQNQAIGSELTNYLSYNTPVNGNIKLWVAGTAGQHVGSMAALGDCGIKGEISKRLHISAGSTAAISITSLGRVAIRPGTPADITNTLTAVGINENTPLAVRCIGTGSQANILLQCANTVTATNNIISNQNGIFFAPFVTASGVKCLGDMCPNGANSFNCGSAANFWSNVRGQNAYITVSDRREKENIVDLDTSFGLDFINKLKPVSFVWKVGENKVINNRDENGELIMGADGNPVMIPIAGVRTHLGLIAQDVAEVVKDMGDLSLWSLDDKDDLDSKQTLKMGELIAPIIKAIQELTTRLNDLEKRL